MRLTCAVLHQEALVPVLEFISCSGFVANITVSLHLFHQFTYHVILRSGHPL